MTEDDKYYLDIFKKRWEKNYKHILLTLPDKEILDIIHDNMTISKALDRVSNKILAAGDADIQRIGG